MSIVVKEKRPVEEILKVINDKIDFSRYIYTDFFYFQRILGDLVYLNKYNNTDIEQEVLEII